MDSKEGNHTIAVLTGHHHVRVYDTRAQRRPIRTCSECTHACSHRACTVRAINQCMRVVVQRWVSTR